MPPRFVLIVSSNNLKLTLEPYCHIFAGTKVAPRLTSRPTCISKVLDQSNTQEPRSTVNFVNMLESEGNHRQLKSTGSTL